jgi:hypothetical protein
MACKFIILDARTGDKYSYMFSVCIRNPVHSFHAVSIQGGDRHILR